MIRKHLNIEDNFQYRCSKQNQEKSTKLYRSLRVKTINKLRWSVGNTWLEDYRKPISFSFSNFKILSRLVTSKPVELFLRTLKSSIKSQLTITFTKTNPIASSFVKTIKFSHWIIWHKKSKQFIDSRSNLENSLISLIQTRITLFLSVRLQLTESMWILRIILSMISMRSFRWPW